MQEQLITFETAKLAKEKGFVITQIRWFNKQGIAQGFNTGPLDDVFYRPSQSLLQKWLREVHGIHVWLIPAEVDKTYRAYVGHGIKLDLLECSYTQSFFTYEDALEEGLQEALKLIEIVKNK